MKPFHRLWYWLCAFFAYWYLRLRIYKYWSLLYRRIYERQYDGVPIAVHPDLQALAGFVARQKWQKDSVRELFDAVSSPNTVQARWQGHDIVGGNDCDEFAIYLTAATRKSLAYGKMQNDGVTRSYFFTVTWFEHERGLGIPRGHNVCLLEYAAHGRSSQWAYMDYGMPSQLRNTIAEVAHDIRSRYSEGAAHWPLVWSVADLDLTPMEVRYGDD